MVALQVISNNCWPQLKKKKKKFTVPEVFGMILIFTIV